MTTLDRITFDPNVMRGRACVRGMRVPVSLVINLVANGMSAQDIIREYSYLQPEDIQQCLRYAALLADGSDNGINAHERRAGYALEEPAAARPALDEEDDTRSGFMDGYEGEFILANDLIPKARLILDSKGDRQAVELDYATWDKVLEFLEDIEDIRELDRIARKDTEYIPWERAKAEFRDAGIDV